MASLSYDLIVLGEDAPGLFAATLCAARGMRVLLAERHKHQSSYRLAGVPAPITPLVLSGLERPGVERLVRELSLGHVLRRKLTPLDPPFQLLAPRLRLEMHPNADLLEAAMKRERGASATWLLASTDAQTQMDEVLERDLCLPPNGFWERREVGKHVSAALTAANAWHDQSSEELDTLLASLCHLTVAHGAATGALPLARSTASVLEGLSSIAGGANAWRSFFLEKFQSHGGEHRVLLPQQIETSWGKVTGLQALEDQIHCDHLVAAMPLQELIPLVSPKVGKRLLPPSPLAHRYTLNLIMHLSGIPEGLSDLATSILDPDAPTTDGNFALLAIDRTIGGGRALVCMEGLASSEDGRPKLEGMRDALLAHARQLMPFLDAHLEVADSPHEVPSNKSVKRDLLAPLVPRPVWDSPVDAQLGTGSLPYTTGIKQLWVANDQTLPSLGLEGACIAAFSAAKLVGAGGGKGKSAAKPSVLSASDPG